METKTPEEVVTCLQSISETTHGNSENLDIVSNLEKHALSNEIILEKVLKFCQLNQDKKSFSSLRQVNKQWDYEICRSLRKTTQIPISRLLAPHPEGLGWTWDPQNDEDCYFDCPYPDIRFFENIKILGTCQQVQNLQLIRFLACEGHQIKSLHFASTLYCGHQTKFVWDILHSWCPNLETLHLTNIQSFSCLLSAYKWEQEFNRVSHWEFNCDKLHSLILSIEDIKPTGEYTECNRDIDNDLSIQLFNYIDSLKALHTDVRRTSKSICSIEEVVNLTKFIELTNVFPSNSVHTTNIEYKRPLPKNFMDFGLFGHILSEAPIKNLVIKKLEKVAFCEDFIIFLLHHPSHRWKTMKNLELKKNVHLGNNRIFAELLCFLQSPLKTLHLDNILPFETSLSPFYKFLLNFGGSVEHLELGNYFKPYRLNERTKILRIPMLPKLKTLVIKSNRCFWFNAKMLLRNAPNLQKLAILENKDEPEDLKNNHVDFFCRILKKKHLDLKNTYQITDLKLAGHLCIRNINNLCNKQFCNMVKVDFSVDGSRVLEHLLKGMGANWKMLRDVKLSIGSKLYAESSREIMRCNYVVRDNINALQGLKFLDITFQHWSKKFVVAVVFFGKGIRKMKSLTSFKLSNFKIMLKEKQLLESCVSHIPYVSFCEMDCILNKTFPRVFGNENDETVDNED